jgi:WD40 repeat protein
MVRTLALLAVLGGVGFVFYAWATGGPETAIKSKETENKRPKLPSDQQERDQPPRGEANRQGTRPPEALNERMSTDVKAVQIRPDNRLSEPLTIPEARVNVILSQNVGASRPGQILFLGKELPEKEALAKLSSGKPNDPDRPIETDMPFLAVETTTEQCESLRVRPYRILGGDTKVYRRWIAKQDLVEPNKLHVLSEKKYFARLQQGMEVTENELLGLVDPSVARNDTEIKIAKLNASEAEATASVKTRDEAEKRYYSLRDANQRAPGSVAPEELRGAQLTWDRYKEEAVAKRHAISVAKQELQQAQTLLTLHEIRATISGVVKDIFKLRGESVKEQDQVLLIQNPSLVKVEGFVEVQGARKLAKGMPIVVEPVQPDEPGVVLRGHREPITGVAVTRGTRPYVVSASEDGTARIWTIKMSKNPETGKPAWTGEEVWKLEHSAPVKSVACSPPGAAHNLCLTGTSDGVGRLWNLDPLDKQPPGELKAPLTLNGTHRGAINAVAFSTDGKWCATGGSDGAIYLWDTDTGEMVHPIPSAHGGSITSLTFTPAKELISTGNGVMYAWTLKDAKRPRSHRIASLFGNVDTLGAYSHVPKEGDPETLVLIDQGQQLRVLSVVGIAVRGVVKSTTGTAKFTTFALFSPDGKTVLSTSSSDNRLQLWRNPALSPHKRAAEMRQYIWTESKATCAAFAPQAPFVVTGMEDRNVLVWLTPGPEELQEPVANAIITDVGKFQENSARQVRIIAEVRTPTPGLMPNGTATMVVYPK